MNWKLAGEDLPYFLEEYVKQKQDCNGYYDYAVHREANPNYVILALVEKVEDLMTDIDRLKRENEYLKTLDDRVQELEKPNSLKFIMEDK